MEKQLLLQTAERVANWTIPPGVQSFVRSYLRRSCALFGTRLNPAEKALLERNRGLYNRHAGERCFILATGPSIKKQDLKLLQGETCIAVSNFFVHPDFDTIQPKYYCEAGYHKPITEEAWQSWMAELDAGTGDSIMFFSFADRERNQRGGRFVNRQVHYLKFGESWDRIFAREVDITRPVPSPQSVTIMALFTAMYMGFQQIYLLGCDHDWILHLAESSHFYDEKQDVLNRAGYNEWFEEDLESYFQSYIRLWQQYKAIRRIANDQSIQIYNATAGGLLDVFERVDYYKLFEEKKHV